MDDAAGPSMLEQAPSAARHTLTVTQVLSQLAEAGVPRSERRIKYFCQTKALNAAKFPTPTGPQWYIDPASVPGLIGDLKQFEEQKRRRLEAAAGSSTPPEAPNSNAAAAGSSRLQPAAAGNENEPPTEPAAGLPQQAAAPYVAQLEKRIEEKDATIKFLQEELVDRRAQISGMKAIIDGQRQLLETINNNVAPVFGALAQLVRGKSETNENIRATFVEDEPKTHEPGPPVA
jgi:hypothetical protein